MSDGKRPAAGSGCEIDDGNGGDGAGGGDGDRGNGAWAAGTDIGAVLVVGAGVAGIRAALDLAEVGYRVLLTDASPAIGGILSKLDYQFPSDHCGMCKMLPVVGREVASQYCMRKSLFHDNIKILPFTEIESIEGEPGAFSVTLIKRARHVDTDVCIGTGYCAEVCPIEVPHEFNQGLSRRKAIYQPVPHNLPNMYLIDMQACDECGKCVEVCPVGAINLELEDERIEVAVDTVIFAAGTGLFDPKVDAGLDAYAVSPDVVTALEFERLISSSGCFEGELRRPSDGRPARRVAWLQCIGSRNRAAGRDFCSSICCMFALKEAVLAHEKGGPEVETTIFYMDMRTFGKDFYRYREYAEQQHGVRLVRCRVHQIDVNADGTLRLRYRDPQRDEWVEGTFDIVVLSTGQTPHRDADRLARLTGIELSATGQWPSAGFDKVRSPREGILMCGSFCGLTDISEALISGSAAASEASKQMTARGRPFKAEVELPAERPVARQQPAVCVLLCRWNDSKMPAGIELEPLRAELERRRDVTEAHVIDTLCRGSGHDEAAAILRATRANRVLFGACLPYLYRQRLKLLAQQAGLNPALVEVVDLRSLIQRHRAEKDHAALMRSIGSRIEIALCRLDASEPLSVRAIPITQQALVVGGGVAGMRAALSLAERGVPVHLVEKAGELGGFTRRAVHYTVDGLDPQAMVGELVQRVWEHKKITVYKGAEVVASDGVLGRFTTRIRNGDGEEHLVTHGATIIATGGGEAPTSEHRYGESAKILTQSELEQRLCAGALKPEDVGSVVMIQCVGSREKGAHEYCSRVCCAAALKNSFKLRELNPQARILVLYRDMMTYGALERFYSQARGDGILFASYDLAAKPTVEVGDDGKLTVQFVDQLLADEVQIEPDLLVLSTGIEAEKTNAELARMFGVELTQDGFFQEADSKWRPVDFLREGLFVAGTAHSPRPLSEVIAQAEAAAQRAFTYLSRKRVTTARAVSRVHDALCARCQSCVAVCPFEARSYDEGLRRIVVDEAACQGCGMCAVACPNSAAEVLGIGEGQTMAVIEASLQGVW